MGYVIISGSSSTSSGGGGSSFDYTVIVTACVLNIHLHYLHGSYLLRFLTSMRQHRIAIRGIGVVVID